VHLDADGEAKPESREGVKMVRLDGDANEVDGDATGVSGAGTTLRGVNMSDSGAGRVGVIILSARAVGRGGVNTGNRVRLGVCASVLDANRSSSTRVCVEGGSTTGSTGIDSNPPASGATVVHDSSLVLGEMRVSV
jgi:hypothetical protein